MLPNADPQIPSIVRTHGKAHSKRLGIRTTVCFALLFLALITVFRRVPEGLHHARHLHLKPSLPTASPASLHTTPSSLRTKSAPAHSSPPPHPTTTSHVTPPPTTASNASETAVFPITFPVYWFAPFFSYSGMGREALSFVLGLYRSHIIPHDKLRIVQDGDRFSAEVLYSFPRFDLDALETITLRAPTRNRAIVICHTFASAWTTGNSRCTLQGHVYRIGRTMFETDSIPEPFVATCNAMDEVWVPSSFAMKTFAAAGVHQKKLHVVPEPVNTTLFDPAAHKPLQLPGSFQLVAGAPIEGRRECTGSKPFVFLSNFKFEPRKGWDVLLAAYFSEFRVSDCVQLYIITRHFESGAPDQPPAEDLQDEMKQQAEQETVLLERIHNATTSVIAQTAGRSPQDSPPVYVLTEYTPQGAFPRIYKSADAFVLPSRGEGWGLPVVEAMAMGLPVIATNWSGITAYLTEEVGYPLAVEGLVAAKGPEQLVEGHKWAQPSVSHLQQLMRRVRGDPDEARRRGEAARKLMVTKYSPEVVARQVGEHLKRIDAMVVKREEEDDKAAEKWQNFLDGKQ